MGELMPPLSSARDRGGEYEQGVASCRPAGPVPRGAYTKRLGRPAGDGGDYARLPFGRGGDPAVAAFACTGRRVDGCQQPADRSDHAGQPGGAEEGAGGHGLEAEAAHNFGAPGKRGRELEELSISVWKHKRRERAS